MAEDDVPKGMTLWSRTVLSYRDMRAATRDLIAERPSEARLLFFVLLSDVIFFLSRGVSLVIAPGSAAVDVMPPHPGIFVLVLVMLRTASLYILSAMITILCRMMGGQGNWRDTRAAVFWAALAAAPVGVLGSLVTASFSHLEVFHPIFAEPLIAMPPHYIGVVALLFFLAAGVAEAHRFSRTSPVFIALSVGTLVAAFGAMVFNKVVLGLG